MSKVVVIRTDASLDIGTGHVMRCISLSHSLQVRDFTVHFVCRDLNGHMKEVIEKNGFQAHLLKNKTSLSKRTTGPGCDEFESVWEQDLDDTIRVIQGLGQRPEWLVVDHYLIDRRWEARIRPMVNRVLVIDDLADREHDCDVLLDQNIFPDMNERYLPLVPNGCIKLLGPKYALLQKIYADMHKFAVVREGKIGRVLISFGGNDSHNLTARALRALIRIGCDRVKVEVVLSKRSKNMEEILHLVESFPHIHINSDLETLAPLMLDSDLAIGAGGTTSWERLCMGLPSIIVSVADNQVQVSQSLHDRGLAKYVGHHSNVSEETLTKEVEGFFINGLDKSFSERCLHTVDGLGSGRVAQLLYLLSSDEFVARPCEWSDEDLLLTWANEPEARSQSFSTARITKEGHHRWLTDRLQKPECCRIYIIESKNEPLGQVRFEKRDDGWIISYSIDRELRGMGLAKKVLMCGLEAFCSEIPSACVRAHVKQGNVPSIRVFESLGFVSKDAVDEIVFSKML